jgi:hypothetical protein
MLEVIVGALILLWLTGNLRISGLTVPQMVLFRINGQPVTVVNLLICIVIIWALGALPSPFREVAGVLFVLWLLSLLGVIAIAGLSNLIVIAIIVGIVISILQKK